MRTFIIGASLVLALLTGPAWGSDELRSANHIMPGCRDQSGYFNKGYCMGLIEGLARGVIRQSIALKVTPPFCPPPAATNGQFIAVVVKYIDQRPERMHEAFTTLAFEALKEAWPCKP